MPRLSTGDFWNRFVEYVRAVHDVLEERFTKAGAAFSHLNARASALLGRLVARGAERAVKLCVDPMLRNVNLREVIETLFDEMGCFIEAVPSPSPAESEQYEGRSQAPLPNSTLATEPLRIASIINKSLTSVLEKLPFWLKALLEAFNELVEIARREEAD